MAYTKLTIMLSSLILLLLASISSASATDKHVPSKTVPKPVEVIVEGMVYCQSCKYSGTWSLSEAKPLGSAKVSVVCKNYKNRVTYYKTFQTEESGYFYAELTGYEMSHPILDHPLHACRIKLVSSPQEECNLLSNINYGMYGAPLHYENKTLYRKEYNAVVYAAGPLAFRPSYCPPEGTHA
ncbi:non-classical arabinogalactan protein 30-like [Syzygium oleosum]|uniref:non-classical arabinogalactan protein 30-like n=1 Tax=Syzygium oleosum TaxID=219896 RepID=UPI0011D1829B|nr:non-classical arabinogalactan protein 30-like [Syzygium oleosum]